MSVRGEPKLNTAAPEATVMDTTPEHPLGEGNGLSVATPDNPLHRNIVVTVRATLNGALVPFFRRLCAGSPTLPLRRPLPSEAAGHVGPVGRGAPFDDAAEAFHVPRRRRRIDG